MKLQLVLARALAPVAVIAAATLGACGDDTKKGATDSQADSDVVDNETAAEVAEETTPEVIEEVTPPFSPQAKIYRVDPITTPNLEQVELEHLTSTDHTLVGAYARVRSCTPDLARGKKIPLDLGGFQIDVVSCVPESKALPGDDGTYLAIAPPATPAADDGRFAEVMMYHHMQVIHDYYKDVHGLTDRDSPLDAITNVQANVCGDWAMIANAAFIPDGGLDQLGFDLDLDINGDSIIFSGTSKRNFSYDGVVIYHEYTHAMLGATRLNAAFVDDQGINNLPGALNESYADYFAGTITNQSAIGNYALNDLEGISICGFSLGAGGDAGRDMEVDKTCPNDLTAQVHADSEIFSSALWEIRKQLGQTDADRVILSSVLTLTNTSDFTLAAAATIDAADELLGAAAAAKVEKAFMDRGLIDCQRVLPVGRVGQRGLPVTLESKDAFSPNPFPGYAPGYLQYSFVVPEGTATITLAINAAGGGGGPLGGGGDGPILTAVFKPGSAPVRYTLGLAAGSGKNDGQFELPVVAGKVVIASGDLPPDPGTWTFALHNSGGSGSLSKITATFE